METTGQDFASQLLETFQAEAEGYHTAIASSLRALMQTDTRAEELPHLEIAFQATHGLKGAAEAVQQTDIEALCHTLEGIFSLYQAGREADQESQPPHSGHTIPLTPVAFETFQRTLDTIEALLNIPEGRHASQVSEAMDALVSLEEEVEQYGQASQIQPSHQGNTGDEPKSASPDTREELEEQDKKEEREEKKDSAQDDPPPHTLPPGLQEQLLAMFRIEAEEHHHTIVNGLLALEKATAADDQLPILEQTFRAAHSLKGAARTVNLVDIETVCQALEDVFARLKSQELVLSPAGFDTLHRTLDAIAALLGSSASDQDQPAEPIADIVALLVALSDTHADKQTEQTEQTERPQTLDFVASTDRADQEEKEKSAPPESPTRLKKAASDSSPTVPREEVEHPVPHVQLSREKVALQTPPASSFALPSTPTVTAPQTAPGLSFIRPATTETIRVSTAKLDGLLLQVEEMLAAKQAVGERTAELHNLLFSLTQWHKEWAKLSPDARKLQRIYESTTDVQRRDQPYLPLAAKLVDFLYWNEQALSTFDSQLKALTRAAERDHQEVSVMVDNLLDDTKKVLMLPFSSLVDIFPKMVRDISRTLGKEVNLIIQGGEVEIDKRILEGLKDPLMHLLRNGIDHGIESPADRREQGKPAGGTLQLAISQVSASTAEVLVSDDGAGIDERAVIRAAVQAGTLSATDAETLNEQAALALIFQSAVTTSPMVTDLSGRGLGMAIVREKVEKLGGQISIETRLGHGTTFKILLPLTLATFRGIFVQAAGHTFVIPTSNVERVIRVRPEEIRTLENRETVLLQDRPIAFARLKSILNLRDIRQAQQAQQAQQGETKDAGYMLALVLGTAEKRIAFCVDQVLSEQEVLFKSLGSYMTQIRYVAGATVLSSGTVVPILHTPDLLRAATDGTTFQQHPMTAGTEAEEKARRATPSVLLAEDSVTSRMLLKGILESAGYQVTTAIDGLDALTTLRKTHFDLLVSDVEMPRLNGFELTTQIRSDECYSQLPVVLVTGLDSQADRDRGIDAGANAYLIKGNFDHSNLLEVVQQLI